MVRTDPPVASEPPGDGPRVAAIGRQWWWEFRIPRLGVVTANELHLPAGERVVLELQAADVIHSFWVPQLAGKRDMIPGGTNYLSFVPQTPGVYAGACTEFCGVQHAWMRLRVVVEPPERFRAWAANEAAAARPPASELAQRGERLFRARNCVSCHAVRGVAEATADAGPDLTHFGSRATIGAGVLANTPENLARWLRNPQEVKPGNLMPNVRLTEDEVQALVAYLEGLR
jgi:cytochrome c oxidase subunit 2